MGERGPLPVDAATREAQGNPGRRPSDVANVDETIRPDPEALTEAPPPPDWLHGTSDQSALAVNAWRQVTAVLVNARFVRDGDQVAIARYCQYLAEWVTLTAELDARGFVVENSTKFGTTYAPNPAGMARSRIEAALNALETQLGLTPKSRMVLQIRLMASLRDLPLAGSNKQTAQDEGDEVIGMLSRAGKDDE